MPAVFFGLGFGLCAGRAIRDRAAGYAAAVNGLGCGFFRIAMAPAVSIVLRRGSMSVCTRRGVGVGICSGCVIVGPRRMWCLGQGRVGEIKARGRAVIGGVWGSV